MARFLDALKQLRDMVIEHIPLFGVFAFSACSIHAVAHLLLGRAVHKTNLYWVASGLIEIATAWVVSQIAGQIRKVTRSIGRGFSKQDRRFAWIVLIVYTVFVIPSFSASVVANYLEFGCDPLLAFLFPVLAVTCAFGAALPGIIEGRERRKLAEKAERAQEKEQRAQEKEQQIQEKARKKLEALWKRAENMGNATETLWYFAENPGATRESVAKALDVTKRTVENHLKRLEGAGLIRCDNGKVDVLIEKRTEREVG